MSLAPSCLVAGPAAVQLRQTRPQCRRVGQPGVDRLPKGRGDVPLLQLRVERAPVCRRLHAVPVAGGWPVCFRRTGSTGPAYSHQCSLPRKQDQPVPGTGAMCSV